MTHEGEKATEQWLLALWYKKEANTPGIIRSKYYCHIKDGWDTILIAKGLSMCDTELKGDEGRHRCHLR